MAGMFASESRRNDDLDRLPEEFAPRVSEERFGLRVDEYDFSALIDRHDRIGSRLQKSAKLVFRAFQLIGEIDFGGDILRDQQESHRPPGGIATRRDDNAGREALAVLADALHHAFPLSM